MGMYDTVRDGERDEQVKCFGKSLADFRLGDEVVLHRRWNGPTDEEWSLMMSSRPTRVWWLPADGMSDTEWYGDTLAAVLEAHRWAWLDEADDPVAFETAFADAITATVARGGDLPPGAALYLREPTPDEARGRELMRHWLDGVPSPEVRDYQVAVRHGEFLTVVDGRLAAWDGGRRPELPVFDTRGGDWNGIHPAY